MSYYEHVIISRPDISSTAVEEMIKHLTEKLDGLGAKIVKVEYWGLRNLAYKINKNNKGHYSMLQLDTDGDVIKEIERQHRINDDIMRYMSVRVDELDAEPSPILKKREDRKRRDNR
ncbi:MAG: 30S ribosomal protein S6 [Robiginitomaculum sp.]